MNNARYYPFERNNYFYGKLLTVRDFDDEQKYVNHKRWLNNILTLGAGVVSGLNIILIDDKTLSIEAGMAIDSMGREIIVDESTTKKLNILEGFDEITDCDNVYLCLKYAEEKMEDVHSVVGSSGNEYNRVSEQYSFFLTDHADENNLRMMEELQTSRKVIYNENGLKITQLMPVYVKSGQPFQAKVWIEKFNLPRGIEVDYIVESDFFKVIEDTGESHNNLRVYCCDDDITPYKKIELKYNMIVRNVEYADTMLTIDPDTSRITIGSQKYKISRSQKLYIKIIAGNVKEAAIGRYFEKHFEEILDRYAQNNIYLAKMRIIKRNAEYSIVDFKWLPFKQYVLSNSMLYSLMSKENYAPVPIEATEVQNNHTQTDPVEEAKTFAGGTEAIGVDLHSRNKVFFSDEISHGLGKGDVYINVAVEEAAAARSIYDQNKTYFGDINMLAGTIFEGELPKMQTAVISYTEKGTFRIAVKLLEDVQDTTVLIKWWAMRSGAVRSKDPSEVTGVIVSVYPDTVTLTPREKFKFNADVSGTDIKECRWSITEENGGQIDINGVYEAPLTEGVYEIIVESVKYPNKKATAFVVVKSNN